MALATLVLTVSRAYWILGQSSAGFGTEPYLETHFVGRNEQVKQIVEQSFFLHFRSQCEAGEQRPGCRIVDAVHFIE